MGVKVSDCPPDVVERSADAEQKFKPKHSLSRIALSFFASSETGAPSMILKLLPLFALAMLVRASTIIAVTLGDKYLMKTLRYANQTLDANQTDANNIFGAKNQTLTYSASLSSRVLPFLSVSSLEHHFQPGMLLWTLYPTLTLLLFHSCAGKVSKGGAWIRLLLDIIESESNERAPSSDETSNAEMAPLRSKMRVELVVNLVLVLIRSTFIFCIGSMIATPVFPNKNPTTGILWMVPQILWIYYASFLILIPIYYLDATCCYFNTCFGAVNQAIGKIISFADSTIPDHDRYQLLRNVLRHHDNACVKISDFNKFWSRYLLASYFMLIPITCINLYQAVFTGHGTKSESILMTVSAVEAIILVTKISGIGAQMNKMAHSSYPLLIRVSFQEFPVDLQIQLRLLIQRLSGPRIGFYCADLFEISHATFFVILLALGQNFLLAVDFATSEA